MEKNLSDSFRKQAEVANHKVVQQTHVAYLKSLHKGLECMFKSLIQFTRKSQETFKELQEKGTFSL